MIATLASMLVGIIVILLMIAANGYFVAQEFGYMAVDRSRLSARAAAGHTDARRALDVTRRTSFMLSGAQLGITVTGLLVGFVTEPLVGDGIGELLGLTGLNPAVGIAIGTIGTLLIATAVQMVFGELLPKNLAIARPEAFARRLALSTTIYLRLFGWIIRLFDVAAAALLRMVGIKPLDDVQHAATARDLEHIVAESRASGDLPAELSALLDRTLEFHDRTAAHAMVPRPQVTTVQATEPVSRVVELMALGHSRFPVLGDDVDDVVGVICLRDILELGQEELDRVRVGQLARRPLLVPDTLPLPGVLEQLRDSKEEFACVVDEYGGLAGVITTEDIAEELVGEIADEHDPVDEGTVRQTEKGTWLFPGSTHTDEVERVIGRDLPPGDYETLGGLIINELRRLPEPADAVAVTLPVTGAEEEVSYSALLTVESVDRHVPEWVRLTLTQSSGDPAQDGQEVRA